MKFNRDARRLVSDGSIRISMSFNDVHFIKCSTKSVRKFLGIIVGPEVHEEKGEDFQ